MKYVFTLFLIFIIPWIGYASQKDQPLEGYAIYKDGRRLNFSAKRSCYYVGNDPYCTIAPVGTNIGSPVRVVITFAIEPMSTAGLLYYNAGPGWTLATDTCSGTYNPPSAMSAVYCDIAFDQNAAFLGKHTMSFNIDIGHSTYMATHNYTLSVETFERKDPCEEQVSGSIIGVTSQTLSERIPIVGTDYFLNYSSDFTNSYTTDHAGLGILPEFNRHLWTISVQHYFQKSNRKLFMGDGANQTVKFMTDSVAGEDLVVSPDGRQIFVFDSTTGIHKETRSASTGSTLYSFGYSSNRLTYIDDAFGNRTVLNYNGSGGRTSIVAPFGQTTTFTRSGSGQLLSVTNPNSETHSMTYKLSTNLLETFTKPGGQVSTFSYDSNGRLIRDLGHGGNKWDLAKTGSDSSGSVSQESNLGRETTFNFTNDGGVHTRYTTTPDGFQTTYINNQLTGSSNIWNAIESRGITQINDERFGEQVKRVASESVTVGSNTKTTNYSQSVSYGSGITPGWFNYHQITTSTTTNAKAWNSVFDLPTLTKTVTSPEGRTRTSVFNLLDQLVGSQVGSDTPWTLTYDIYGRLTNRKQGLTQNSLTYAYNGSGYLSSVTNALSEVTSFGYDNAGRVTSVTLPDTRVISKAYDANGNLLTVTPPGRPAHAFLYNAMEEVSDYQPPSIGVGVAKNTSYAYNNDKQLTLVTLPSSETIGFTYNGSTGLLTTRTVPSGNYSYTYDSTTKQLEKIVSPNGPASVFDYYGYQRKDDEQRRNSDNYLFGKVAFTFDSEHRLSSRITQPSSSSGASTINYSYNNDDELSQVGDLALTYSYPSGRLSTTTIGNIADARTYDVYGNLITYTATYTPTITVLYSYTLTRDVTSRITAKSENVLGTTINYVYSYDSAGRLTAMSVNGTTTTTFTYDSNSNRTSGTIDGVAFTATYDNQDRILTYNSRTYNHNTNGYLTGIQWTPTSSSSFVYDVMGNLKQTTLPSGAVHTFDHDGLDRRVTKSIGSTLQWRAVYEDQLRIAAYVNNTAGTLAKEFVYATRINVPDYMITGGVKYRIITDHLGSPRLMVKTTDGTIAQRMDYNVLGEVKSDTNPSFQPFGFTGGIYEPGVQLVRFGARDYDPRAGGRWTSKDPIRFDGGDMNLYGYVLSDPVNFIDPEGRAAVLLPVVAVVGGAIVGGAMAGYEILFGPLTVSELETSNINNVNDFLNDKLGPHDLQKCIPFRPRPAGGDTHNPLDLISPPQHPARRGA
ncbi:MAG: hypothetical protein K2Q26_11000 [Bdellovibrionales bacterium]|nr:hypothetical protein [Bdellovibrionales bacterium]